MRVTLEGRKIGHLHSIRKVEGDRVVTTSTTRFEIDRGGTPLVFESSERHTETVAGVPLEFEAITQMGGTRNSVRGRIANARLHVEQQTGDAVDTRTLPWPTGAVLSEGARLRQMAAGLAPGTTLSIPTYLGDSLTAATTNLRVVGRERVMLSGRSAVLVRVEQSIEVGGARIEGTVWVDRWHRAQRVRLPLLGVALEMLDCDRACALAPNQSTDVLARTLVEAPTGFDRDILDGPVRYRIRIAPSAGNARLAETAEQRVRRVPGSTQEWEVLVTPIAGRAASAGPVPADAFSTAWLQSDDADVKRLARTAVGAVSGAAERMSLLEAAVRKHIGRKNLSIGYASAAETADSGEGDCTEHALLLAAMARSVGIPSRVVSGLAFAPEFVDRKRVFVPHAWTQAWVDGRWRSYDAALAGFDAGHIAFGVGDGDPVGFFHSVGLLGATRIVSAEAVSLDAILPAPAPR